jgi:hypothetical protein
MAGEETLRKRQKQFIERERLRRRLIATKPGETICLQSEEVEMLLKWVKELEERLKTVLKYGNQKN